MHGVAALSRELAHALAHDDGILELGVATLETDVATALAKHRRLDLVIMTDLSDEAAVAATTPPAAIEMLDAIVSPAAKSRLAVELSAIPSMTDDVERVWTLLRSAADDPATIQAALSNLLERADDATLRGVIATLGLAGLATMHGASPADANAGFNPLETIMGQLMDAEVITARKRDRLKAWQGEHRRDIDNVIRRALLDYLVASEQLSQGDADEIEPRPNT